MRKLLFALAFLSLALPISAQDDQPDPFKTARVRFGPFAFNPRITLTNVGVDTNVFNEWDDPKRDFSATLTPASDVWFRAGRTLLTGRAGGSYVYFQQYARERGFNSNLEGRYELDLFHVRPYVVASYVNSRERLGFEVDARARRFDRAYGIGADVPLTRRTTFGMLARRQRSSYAAEAVYLGASLRAALDRREDTLQASFRYRVTSLTTLVLKGSAERTRFVYSPGRDADGVRVMPGVEFSAFAIVQGSAYVGLRKVDMLGPNMPRYRGAVADANLSYTLLGSTRFAVQASRDVYYSYDLTLPYYVQTGFLVGVTQRLKGPFDAQARAGQQHLDYALRGQSAFLVARRDAVRTVGGGIGYRFGSTARLGFNVDWYRRTSPLEAREYKGLRAGTSLSYGL